MQPALWRLIRTEPAEGAWNMAVDEAILEAVGSGDALPTLRHFRARASLGSSPVVATIYRKHAVATRRRPTGGQAILHTDELTFGGGQLGRRAQVARGVLEAARAPAARAGASTAPGIFQPGRGKKSPLGLG